MLGGMKAMSDQLLDPAVSTAVLVATTDRLDQWFAWYGLRSDDREVAAAVDRVRAMLTEARFIDPIMGQRPAEPTTSRPRPGHHSR
ncbi:hypothetical protein AB0B10_25280 [Micromonospora arborensis]|uniref:hypothetical protein n=1 Tax=Micromonospora arborensis TaxID=2116518 RepID=UPI0033C8A103